MKFIVYGATKGRGDGIGRSASLALQRRGHETDAQPEIGVLSRQEFLSLVAAGPEED